MLKLFFVVSTAFFPAFFTAFFASQAQAFTAKPLHQNRQPAGQTHLTLSMKKVIQTVIKNSLEYKNILARQNTLILPVLKTQNIFNWKLNSEFKNTFQTQGIDGSNTQTLLSQLEKKTITGTKAAIEHSALAAAASAPYKLKFKIEQDLLRNILGKEDQYLIQKAAAQTKLKQLQLREETESLIEQAALQFWAACLSKLSLKLKQFKKRDYQELARLARKKHKYKYLRPGELNQMRAELEGAKQEVIIQKAHYKDQLKLLLNLLQMPNIKKMHCQITKNIPPPPVFKKQQSPPRLITIRQKNIFIKEKELALQKSKNLPFVKAFSTYDLNTNTEPSLETFTQPPGWSLGVKVQYAWPSYKNLKQNVFVKQQALEAEKLNLQTEQNELDRLITLAKNNLQSLYLSVKSSKKIHRLRALSYKQVRKAYLEGRLSVFELISAREAAQQSEMDNISFIAKYYTELIRSQALNDELLTLYMK